MRRATKLFSTTDPLILNSYYTNANIASGQVTLTVRDFNNWGSKYRNYIYSELPIAFNEWKSRPENANFVNHEFLFAKCAISRRTNEQGVMHYPVGVSKICKFGIPGIYKIPND